MFSVSLLAKVSRAVFDTLAVCYTILWWWLLWFFDYEYDDNDDDYHNDDDHDYELWWSKPGSRQPPDSDEDSGRRGLVVGIPQQPEVIFIFRTNLKWAFVSIRLSVSPTNHPPMHPFLHPSIHPSILACQPVQLTSWQARMDVSTPYLAVSQRSARDVDDQPVEKQGVNIHQEHRVQSDRWRCHHYELVKEDADDIFRKILLSPLTLWSRMIVLHLSFSEG